MSPEFASIFFGLAASLAYGLGDFSGGYASRRAPLLMVLLLSQGVGLIGFAVLVMISGETLSDPGDLLWGAAAGLAGLVGVLALYQALAVGQMSLAAPITGVLGAAIPVVFTALTAGLPDVLSLAGFAMALAGIWYISRPKNGEASSSGVGLALIGGFAFGLFFIFLAQFREEAVFLPLVAARLASVTAVLVVAGVRRELVIPGTDVLPIILFAGFADGAGNALFVLAEQSGRLDIATVLSSLYPMVTVLLALLLLKERLTRPQLIGILLTVGAIVLIAAGG